MSEASIFHLAPGAELRTGLVNGRYTPAAFDRDGFVHCSFEASVLPVANDYYADAEEPLLLLEIDPNELAAETRYEAPAPIQGGGTAHLEDATVFPHVYGPIEVQAVRSVGVLVRTPNGYAWPERFVTLEAFLEDARG